MAEQFIIKNATSRLVREFVKAVPCTITDVFHTNIGWTAGSRAAYNGMMGLPGGAALVGRGPLPPHFYIELAANTYVPNFGDTDLVRNLSRGVLPVVLKALDGASQALWAEGRYFDALNSELTKGNVSLSLFHLDGQEVTQQLRDAVANLLKKKN